MKIVRYIYLFTSIITLSSVWLLCYITAWRLMVRVPGDWINVSSLTVNLILGFALSGLLGVKIGEKLFPTRKYLQWLTMALVMFFMIYWLSLFGYETRW